MESRLRFGILGTGNIAGQFAEGVAGAQHSVVTAVGSRSEDSAAAFAQRFGLDPAQSYGSYDDLIGDQSVDAVYLSLPNHLHAPWTVKTLEAGKHVLCEKPLAMNADEAERMFAAADWHDRRLMEAFMYRCHPLTSAVVGAVRGGAIGQLKTIRASFCYRTSRIDGNVRFDPTIGGGALMDIGCYCLDFCRLVVGRPPIIDDAHVVGNLHETGVDDFACVVLKFTADPDAKHPALAGPITAALTFGMTVQLDNTAHLGGTDGHLQVPVPWKPPQCGAAYIVAGQTPPKQDLAAAGSKAGPPAPRVFTVDADAPLYGLEADAFAGAVAGRKPLPITPDESLGNARLLETLRKRLGLPW